MFPAGVILALLSSKRLNAEIILLFLDPLHFFLACSGKSSSLNGVKKLHPPAIDNL